MTVDWRILAGVFLFLVVAFAGLLVLNANLRADLALAKTENVALHFSNDDFRAKVEKQNLAVASLHAEAVLRARLAVAAVKDAEKRVGLYKDAAVELGKRKAVGDDCGAALNLFKDYARGAK